jgi:hypothetical protein
MTNESEELLNERQEKIYWKLVDEINKKLDEINKKLDKH